jgi:hypothetical protein
LQQVPHAPEAGMDSDKVYKNQLLASMHYSGHAHPQQACHDYLCSTNALSGHSPQDCQLS